MSAQSDGTPLTRQTVAEMAELAGGLAHELRNPLSTMMINLKLLAEDLQDTGAHESDVRRRALLKVDVLRREAERLQGLFDDFLNLTGPCRLQRTSIDMRLVVDRLVEFIEPMARRHGIDLEVSTGDVPVPCWVDENLLGQALLNIAINAQESMPDGGRLRFTVASDADAVTVSVSDTGIGIPSGMLERIGRPFFSTKAHGTGLGLSITQRIINEHGGSMRIESEQGRGTSVTIRLLRSSGDGVTA